MTSITVPFAKGEESQGSSAASESARKLVTAANAAVTPAQSKTPLMNPTRRGHARRETKNPRADGDVHDPRCQAPCSERANQGRVARKLVLVSSFLVAHCLQL